MTCLEFADRLTAIARGESVESLEAALAHARTCHACGRLLAREQRLTSSLAALAAVERERQPSARLDGAVMAAWTSARTRGPNWTWRAAAVATMAAAMLLVLGTVRYLSRPDPPRTASVDRAPVTSPSPEPPAPPVRRAVAGSVATPAGVDAVGPVAGHPMPGPAPRRAAVATFVPLVPEGVLFPGEPLQLMRVRLPRMALAGLGLPVGDGELEDDLQADVLLGEDGTARAIRLVPASVVSN